MFELVMQYGQPVLFWVLSILAGLFGKYVVTLTKNKYAQGVMQRAYAEIDAAVKQVSQTYVDELKRASLDGTLTDEEKAKAKAMAVAVFEANFGGAAALKKLAKVLGLDDISEWVMGKVEAAVVETKLPPQ